MKVIGSITLPLLSLLNHQVLFLILQSLHQLSVACLKIFTKKVEIIDYNLLHSILTSTGHCLPT